MLADGLFYDLLWCDARPFNFCFDQFVSKILAKLEIAAVSENLSLRAASKKELQWDFETLDMAQILAE